MIALNQNDLEYILDLHSRGKITTEQANIEKVKMARVCIVGKLPADVRSALNSAVKCGELCHKRKNGRKPEVYYHPSFEHLADKERNRIEVETIKALAKVCQ